MSGNNKPCVNCGRGEGEHCDYDPGGVEPREFKWRTEGKGRYVVYNTHRAYLRVVHEWYWKWWRFTSQGQTENDDTFEFHGLRSTMKAAKRAAEEYYEKHFEGEKP